MPLFWSSASERLRELHPWHLSSFDGLPLPARVAATLAEAGAEAGDAQTLVISNEWFSLGFEDGLHAPLVDELPRYGDVTAIAVLRDQGDVMISAWCRQIMDRSFTGPLERMTARRADWGKPVKPLNHHALASAWSSLCDLKLLRHDRHAARRIADICGVPSNLDFPARSERFPLALATICAAQPVGPCPTPNGDT